MSLPKREDQKRKKTYIYIYLFLYAYVCITFVIHLYAYETNQTPCFYLYIDPISIELLLSDSILDSNIRCV